MATWDDVRRLALSLPATTQTSSAAGDRQWRVRSKTFLWERPLRAADLRALGPTAPAGPVLAASVQDVGVREALLTDDPQSFFTTPHFRDYPAVLVRLDDIDLPDLDELVHEAWRVRAPGRLVQQHGG